jgi:hypothetical protein
VTTDQKQDEFDRLEAQIRRELELAASDPEHVLQRRRRERRDRPSVAERHHLTEQRS